MSIFDQIGKKLSNVSSNALDATRSMAEIQKLTNEINSSGKSIDRIYREIGEEYYLAHREEASGEFGSRIQEINSLAAHMEELQQQIDRIKAEREAAKTAGRTQASPDADGSDKTPGDRYCPHCGSKIPADSIFCIKCGTRLDTEEKEPDQADEGTEEVQGQAVEAEPEEAQNSAPETETQETPAQSAPEQDADPAPDPQADTDQEEKGPDQA